MICYPLVVSPGNGNSPLDVVDLHYKVHPVHGRSGRDFGTLHGKSTAQRNPTGPTDMAMTTPQVGKMVWAEASTQAESSQLR